MTPLAVLSTCPLHVAESLARSLVENRVAACVNILPAVQSIFRWEDKVEIEQEAMLIIKTSAEQWESLQEQIRQQHPYDVPELIALPVTDGLPQYMEWLGRALTD